jgi:hypothetical protein
MTIVNNVDNQTYKKVQSGFELLKKYYVLRSEQIQLLKKEI